MCRVCSGSGGCAIRHGVLLRPRSVRPRPGEDRRCITSRRGRGKDFEKLPAQRGEGSEKYSPQRGLVLGNSMSARSLSYEKPTIACMIFSEGSSTIDKYCGGAVAAGELEHHEKKPAADDQRSSVDKYVFSTRCTCTCDAHAVTKSTPRGRSWRTSPRAHDVLLQRTFTDSQSRR